MRVITSLKVSDCEGRVMMMMISLSSALGTATTIGISVWERGAIRPMIVERVTHELDRNVQPREYRSNNVHEARKRKMDFAINDPRNWA